MITEKDFRGAFKAEWDEYIRINEPSYILEKYTHKEDWTLFMLEKENGFLVRVMERLNSGSDKLEYRGYYTIDVMYVSGDLYREGCSYPTKLHVLIEHENGNYIEEEMWKLIFWRSPLKVIIFYDWDEDERTRSDKKHAWLNERLENMRNMLTEANSFHPEYGGTQYLFIIGNREHKNMTPIWRYATCENIEPKYL